MEMGNIKKNTATLITKNICIYIIDEESDVVTSDILSSESDDDELADTDYYTDYEDDTDEDDTDGDEDDNDGDDDSESAGTNPYKKGPVGKKSDPGDIELDPAMIVPDVNHPEYTCENCAYDWMVGVASMIENILVCTVSFSTPYPSSTCWQYTSLRKRSMKLSVSKIKSTPVMITTQSSTWT